MADDDALRLLAPFKNFGDDALQNLAKLARERPDSLDSLIKIGRQDSATVDNLIRIGRQDSKTVDNIIMLGVEPKETLGTMIQGARDRQNADRWQKVRWQILSKWLLVLGGIGTALTSLQAIPYIIGILKKGWSH